MDCAGDEYLLNGKCQKCLQCPPGQELNEDCGYGLGGSSTCGACALRWFKADWGLHPCRMCQICTRLGRQEVTSCTHTHNAVCGGCLPGFYSKRRLDGLQDLECLACGPAHFRNVQCRGEEIMEKVWSSEAPPHNSSVMMTTCVAAVTMVTFLFLIVVLMHQGFGSLKRLLRGCLTSSSSRHDPTAASICVAVTMEDMVTQEGGGVSELCQSSTYPFLVSMPTTSDPSPHLCESPPLLHGSICRNPTSGVVTQATGSPLPLAFTEDLTTEGRCCAGVQEEGWGQHGPVECTELEFLNLSFPSDQRGSMWPVGQHLLSSQSAPSPIRSHTPVPGDRLDLLELGAVQPERYLSRDERGGCRGGEREREGEGQGQRERERERRREREEQLHCRPSCQQCYPVIREAS